MAGGARHPPSTPPEMWRPPRRRGSRFGARSSVGRRHVPRTARGATLAQLGGRPFAPPPQPEGESMRKLRRVTRAEPPPAAAPTRALEREPRAWLWPQVAAYIVLYAVICAIKLRYYLYGDFDFAIFAQATDRMLAGS